GEGDLDRAASLHEESLLLARKIEDQNTEARAISNLAAVELGLGHLGRVETLLRENLQLSSELQDLDGIASALELQAALHVAKSEFESAARLLGAARGLRERIGVPSHPERLETNASTELALKQRLGDRYLTLALAGAALDWEAAVSL